MTAILTDITKFFNILLAHPAVLLFLAATLAVGLLAHLQTKSGSFEDYAMASYSMPTAVLVMTFLGTFLSAGHFAFAGWVADKGVMLFIAVFMIVATCCLLGTFVAPMLVHFSDMVTMGDMMGAMYGRIAKVVTGVYAVVISIVLISGQFKIMGAIASKLLGADPAMAIVILTPGFNH